MIKRFTKNNALPYYIWFKLIREKKSRLSLPQKGDLFYFDGYPRSGNTYTTSLIKFFFEGIRFSHHLHTVGAVKIALSKNVPPLLIFRDPYDAIPSLYITKFQAKDLRLKIVDTKVLNEITKGYVDYYSFSLKHLSKVKLIAFQEVIEEPSLFLQFLIKEFNLPETDNILEKIEHHKAFIKSKEGKKKLKYSSLPNEQRTELKQNIKSSLAELPSFQNAQTTYHNLQQHKHLGFAKK